MRRRIRALLLASVIAGAGLVPFAAPVAAAGSTTQPDIFGCFKWSNGTTYTYTVYLDRWNATYSRWDTARTGTANSSGCVRFNDLAVGYYFRLRAYYQLGSSCLVYNSYYGIWTGTGIYYFGPTVTDYVGPTRANDTLYRWYNYDYSNYYWTVSSTKYQLC